MTFRRILCWKTRVSEFLANEILVTGLKSCCLLQMEDFEAGQAWPRRSKASQVSSAIFIEAFIGNILPIVGVHSQPLVHSFPNDKTFCESLINIGTRLTAINMDNDGDTQVLVR